MDVSNKLRTKSSNYSWPVDSGVTVHECHATLSHSAEERMEQASGGWHNPKALDILISLHLIAEEHRLRKKSPLTGTTKQSHCTIQNKIWEGMMMQRSIVTSDAEPIHQGLTHEQYVFLVERVNPQALADAILLLNIDPHLRQKMAAAAFEHVQNNRVQAIGHLVQQVLSNLVA